MPSSPIWLFMAITKLSFMPLESIQLLIMLIQYYATFCSLSGGVRQIHLFRGVNFFGGGEGLS